jgi:hypothetical protein
MFEQCLVAVDRQLVLRSDAMTHFEHDGDRLTDFFEVWLQIRMSLPFAIGYVE